MEKKGLFDDVDDSECMRISHHMYHHTNACTTTWSQMVQGILICQQICSQCVCVLLVYNATTRRTVADALNYTFYCSLVSYAHDDAPWVAGVCRKYVYN